MSLSSPKADKFEFEYIVVVVVVLLVIVVLLIVVIIVIIVVIILMMEDYELEVLAKTPGLYQVPELGNWISKKSQNLWTDGRTDRPMDGWTYTIR